MLLSSKGRSASVSVDDAESSSFSSSVVIANRSFRSVSNQIEEDAVNGLLEDLLSPMAEERRARAPVSSSTNLPDVTQTAAAAASAPTTRTSKLVSNNDDSDSGVSDSTDDEEDGSFFPDNVGSPKLGRSSSSSTLSAASLLQQLRPNSPPPAKLEPQVSVLSWRDYLKVECPVCEELRLVGVDHGKIAGVSICAPCGAPVCKSCVLVFKQKGEQLFVRVCRKCRSKVPADGEMICGACCTAVLGSDDETRCCTECHRRTCFSCCRLYCLTSLGETEPRAVCSACVSEVQAKLSSYPRKLDLSSMTAPPPELERKSSGSFWKALKSPRRETNAINTPASPPPSSPVSSSPRKGVVKKGLSARKGLAGARDSVPFPGVKLHVSADAFPGVRSSNSVQAVPESIAVRKMSRPVPLSKVSFAASAEDLTTRVALVTQSFEGVVSSGQLSLVQGQAVRVHEEKGDGWAVGSFFADPSKRGLFPIDCVTFDAAAIEAAAQQSEREARVEIPKFAVGTLVRAMVGPSWTECEVVSAGRPYAVRALDGTVLHVDEADLVPSVHLFEKQSKQRQQQQEEQQQQQHQQQQQEQQQQQQQQQQQEQQHQQQQQQEQQQQQQNLEAAEAEVLDSLKNRVLKMQQERVGSFTNLDPVYASPLPQNETEAEITASAEVEFEEKSTQSAQHRFGKALVAAVRDKDIGQALKALDEGADPNYKAGSAGTPLVLAAKLGHMKLVLLLLQRGADACAQTLTGWTALHFAAKAGNKEMAELLLSYGARNDVVNEWMKGGTKKKVS